MTLQRASSSSCAATPLSRTFATRRFYHIRVHPCFHEAIVSGSSPALITVGLRSNTNFITARSAQPPRTCPRTAMPVRIPLASTEPTARRPSLTSHNQPTQSSTTVPPTLARGERHPALRRRLRALAHPHRRVCRRDHKPCFASALHPRQPSSSPSSGQPRTSSGPRITQPGPVRPGAL